MKTAIRNLLLLVSLGLSLTACQSLTERDDADKMQHALDTYGAAVRWQPLVAQYSFLKPELRPEELPAGLDNLRVTAYEVTVPPHMLSKDQVAQTVLIEYVELDRQVVRRLVDEQRWERTGEKTWQRINPIPTFK